MVLRKVVATLKACPRGIWMKEAPLCLPSTVTAALSAEMDSSKSFSSALNSASCFSLSAVAVANDSWSSATSFSRFLISVLNRLFLSRRNGEVLGRDPLLVEELVPVSALSADVAIDVDWVRHF